MPKKKKFVIRREDLNVSSDASFRSTMSPASAEWIPPAERLASEVPTPDPEDPTAADIKPAPKKTVKKKLAAAKAKPVPEKAAKKKPVAAKADPVLKKEAEKKKNAPARMSIPPKRPEPVKSSAANVKSAAVDKSDQPRPPAKAKVSPAPEDSTSVKDGQDLMQRFEALMLEHGMDSDSFIETMEASLSDRSSSAGPTDKDCLITELTAKVGKLEETVEQGRDGIKKLKRACIEMKEQREKLQADHEERLKEKDREKEEALEEAQEEYDDELATANGMLAESEDVRLRVEAICSKLLAGIVVFDREGRVVTSINAEDVPFLQTANMPPPELVEALRNFNRESIVECENIQIFEVLRDQDGYLASFLFMPREDNTFENRSRHSVIDILDELGEEEDFDKLVGDLGNVHPVRKGGPQEAALENTDPTDSLKPEPLPRALAAESEVEDSRSLLETTTKIVVPPPANPTVAAEPADEKAPGKDPSQTPTVTLKRRLSPGVPNPPQK